MIMKIVIMTPIYREVDELWIHASFLISKIVIVVWIVKTVFRHTSVNLVLIAMISLTPRIAKAVRTVFVVPGS